jgi:hypothetical protein
MRVQLTAILVTLSCSQSLAGPNDRLKDYNSPLNACMYRYGLTAIGYQFSPSHVRSGVTAVCAAQIEESIDSLISPEPDGKISLDTEGYETKRKAASQSTVLKFMIDDFMKNYQASLKGVNAK